MSFADRSAPVAWHKSTMRLMWILPSARYSQYSWASEELQMLFDKILVSVDGSVCSQVAVDYALWLAGDLGASVSAQHVMDPRLLALIIAPEFAENLGFGASINAAEKVTAALKIIGNTV